MSKTSIGSTALHLSTESKQFIEGLAFAESRFKKHTKQIEGDAQSLRGSVSKAFDFGDLLKFGGAVAGAAGGILGGLSLAGLVTDSVKLAAGVEDTAATFKVLVGDAERARVLFQDIRDFAAKTPLTTNELADAAKALLGVGIEAEQVIPTLKILGDLAQGDGEKLKSLAIVYGQVRSAGRLMGQDLMQFINANVALVGPLAKTLNIAEAEVKRFIEEGKVETVSKPL